MIFLPFVSLLFAGVVRASPLADTDQAIFRHSDTSTSADIASESAIYTSSHDSESIYEIFHHASLEDYALRVTCPEPTLCDPSVKQHAGFFDISDEKHLFFWFFESRKAPEKAPLTLWLNGGPGGSSALGMLTELGPCTIAHEGANTTLNPYSWNTYSNIIFLDQPVNVGFSYASEGAEVDNTPVAAEDVYAFLQLFLAKYPKYAKAPFHIAGESYGGTYVPHVASVIHRKNKELSTLASSESPRSTLADLIPINLASILLGNGHTDPKIQFSSVPDYVCDGPYALLDSDGPECTAWRKKLPTCERLVQTCYDFDTPLTCKPAALYCWVQGDEATRNLDRNPYDVRKFCDPEKEPLCYQEFDWVQTWMNSSATKKAIGIDPSLNFEVVNLDVNTAFQDRGDSVRNSAALLPELVEDGIRLLVYAGMADMACNYIGNEAWVTKMESKFHDEFERSPHHPWTTIESGTRAGEVRYAGGGGETAGNVTFVKIYEAGHMVPYDQPDAALDLFTRWILDVPLSFANSDIKSLQELL